MRRKIQLLIDGIESFIFDDVDDKKIISTKKTIKTNKNQKTSPGPPDVKDFGWLLFSKRKKQAAELFKAKEVKQKFDNIKVRRRAVICGNADIFDNKILYDVVFLASFEKAYRSRSKWQEPDNEVCHLIAGEVQALANVWMHNSERFGPASQPIWSNPSFGGASAFVGGADADVVVGNTLWDFKTTKYFKYNNTDWAQLLGYVILSKWNKSPFNINRVVSTWPGSELFYI